MRKEGESKEYSSYFFLGLALVECLNHKKIEASLGTFFSYIQLKNQGTQLNHGVSSLSKIRRGQRRGETWIKGKTKEKEREKGGEPLFIESFLCVRLQ